MRGIPGPARFLESWSWQAPIKSEYLDRMKTGIPNESTVSDGGSQASGATFSETLRNKHERNLWFQRHRALTRSPQNLQSASRSPISNRYRKNSPMPEWDNAGGRARPGYLARAHIIHLTLLAHYARPIVQRSGSRLQAMPGRPLHMFSFLPETIVSLATVGACVVSLDMLIFLIRKVHRGGRLPLPLPFLLLSPPPTSHPPPILRRTPEEQRRYY